MCPANNPLQCPASGCAPKVDTYSSRVSLQTVLGSGPVWNSSSESHQKSSVTFFAGPWPTRGMMWWGWCCVSSSCRLRSDTEIIQPGTILADMGDDVRQLKAFYSPVSKPHYSPNPSGLLNFCKVALILSERNSFLFKHGKTNSLNWTLCFAFVSLTKRFC